MEKNYLVSIFMPPNLVKFVHFFSSFPEYTYLFFTLLSFPQATQPTSEWGKNINNVPSVLTNTETYPATSNVEHLLAIVEDFH